MSNEDFLKNNLNKYESLRYFTIQNGILIFNNGQITYSLAINHLNLQNLDNYYSGIFLLNPTDIFNLLYMLELFFKPELAPNDIEAIKQYVNNYLEINRLYIDGDQSDEFLASKLAIPIDMSYNDNLAELKVSLVIHDVINTYNANIESGKHNGLRLVRNIPGVGENNPEEDNFIINNYSKADDYINYTKAGFIAFLLIIGTVIATCIYIIFAIYS